jgi:hypothetical protein
MYMYQRPFPLNDEVNGYMLNVKEHYKELLSFTAGLKHAKGI